MCREDIPQSKILDRRRIVKLHGSFPSQRPFIFTEEDYRRYPDSSAPFINLVRQSMLENVFCLIGFSGDDPNFLYWIGWVRDMLDEHALPIYLFVIRPPSLGTQKLLESRRVTAVVLPMKPGVEEWDYAGRFATLFETLKKPLAADVMKWGKPTADLELTVNPEHSGAQRHEQIVTAFSALREMRNSYPGWFVAPYAIRNRFYLHVMNLHDLLHASQVREHFLTEAPHAAIAILADYSWQLEVVLQSMNDALAGLAIELLDQIDPTAALPSPAESTDLPRLQAQTPQEFRQRWKELALGVARWAREGLHQLEFSTISESLRMHFPTDLQITDQLVYDDVLLKLYTGERDIAHLSLKNWDVRSPDSYMLVKKGVLLGELGDDITGLKVALVGLKRLRKNQRARANSTLALSQEAWACLAIGNLQKSRQFDFRQSDDEPLEDLPELVTQRLTDLAAAGHDVGREVLQLTADLNAETRAPSPPVTYTPLFELGRYSTTRHLGVTHSYREKVHAAFAWLSLTDRVALVPRAGNATFNIDSFAQAAWWVQYAVSMQRVLGVVMRLLNSKMLKPRSHTQLIHSAGWLSRFQVARTPEVLAQELFDRSMNFVERMVQQAVHSDVMERTIEFHLQVLSRLIIRAAAPGFTASRLERIVRLYKSKQMLSHPTQWEEATNLTAHCFEALSALERLDAVASLASIPDRLELNIRNRFHEKDWLSLHLLARREGDLVISKPSDEIANIVDQLIGRLVATGIGPDGLLLDMAAPTESIWVRLFWLKDWGGVSKAQIARVGKLLLNSNDWPSIPGHYPWAVFTWLSKAQKKSAGKRYTQWMLRQELTRFSSDRPSAEGPSRRSWALRDADSYLMNLYQSLELSEWSEDDLVFALLIIKRWWDAEWPFIQPELVRLDDVKAMFLRRMRLIDLLIASFIDKHSLNALKRAPALGGWIEVMQAGLVEVGSSLLRTNLASALDAGDRVALAQMDVTVLLKVFDYDLNDVSHISNVISYWAKHPKAGVYDAPNGLIYSLAGVVSARRMPVLPWALGAFTKIMEKHPGWVMFNCYTLLNVGLKMLLSELAYVGRPDNTGIPDDDVPLLRLECVTLARALRASKFFEQGDACELWLAETSTDPLPELRFFPV
jgi:hypothetical protein